MATNNLLSPDEDAESATAHWNDRDWQASAASWVRSILPGSVKIDVVQVRPWATVHRLESPRETYWFKATTGDGRRELELTRFLHNKFPSQIPEVVASDDAEGWWILKDAGPSLNLREDRAPLRAEAMLAYGSLQRSTSAFQTDLEMIGVPSVPPSAIPRALEELLAQDELLGRGTEHGISEREHFCIGALLSNIGQWADELESIGVPATIQQDDLSDANICHKSGNRFVFIDWADAYFGHPFSSMLFPEREELASGGVSAVEELRNRYLEGWKGPWDIIELSRAAALAQPIAVIGKALSWNRAMGDIHREPLGPYYAYPEARWLRKLLDPRNHPA